MDKDYFETFMNILKAELIKKIEDTTEGLNTKIEQNKSDIRQVVFYNFFVYFFYFSSFIFLFLGVLYIVIAKYIYIHAYIYIYSHTVIHSFIYSGSVIFVTLIYVYTNFFL